MLAARFRAHRTLGVFLLAGLVLLASSQHALHGPHSQALPLSFLPGAEICTLSAGSSNSQPSPSPSHTHQPHCPLCVMGGYSDGATPFVSLPKPVLQIGERLWPLEAAQPYLEPVFPRLNRGPPQLG